MLSDNDEEDTVNIKNKKVYYITEGRKTEPGYIKNFQKVHKGEGFILTQLSKDKMDLDLTERSELIELAHGIIEYSKSGKLSFFYLSKLMLDEYYCFWVEKIKNKIHMDVESTLNLSEMKDIYDDLNNTFCEMGIANADTYDQFIKNELEKQCVKRFKELDADQRKKLVRFRSILLHKNNLKFLDSEGFIIDFNKAREYICTEFLNKSDNFEYSEEYKLNNFILKDPAYHAFDSNDRIFIIMDRDYDMHENREKSDDKFRKIVEHAENEYNFEILLSTPAFEIWLLMHHSGNDYREYYSGKPYLTKIEERLKSIEKLDADHMKKIDKARFEKYYMNKFDFAVSESLSTDLCHDIPQLVYDAGSNVGIKLASLLKK